MTPERPNPEKLLAELQREELQAGKGKLKIFLGLAAGVGKTYAMLTAANRLREEGVDVLVGIVETHDRQETAALLKNLKILSPKKQSYKGKQFNELDVDRLIAIHPEVALVDELAHHNVPGSKHSKRWQDVVEILDAGIDVYTTLNVQHIESLNDIIRGITNVNIRETIPDHVVELAASIQLVDLTPDELLLRLSQGRVYFDEQSKTASENFFKKEKLTALREISLRFAADKVDRDLRRLAVQEENLIDWKPRELFLTAISPTPHSQKLIRTTRRLAATNDAPWIAIYVDTGKELAEQENDQLARNFALARDLGAEVITSQNPNIANGLKRIARQRGVTQIIVGRPAKSFLHHYIRGNSIVEQLTAECRDADIHIIREEKNPVEFRRRLPLFFPKTKWSMYFSVFAIISSVALISWFTLPFIGYHIVGVFFLTAILLISLFFKQGPVLFSALLSSLIWFYCFIPPSFEFFIHSGEDIAMLIIFFITAITAGVLLTRGKEHKELLEKSEDSTRALYEMVHQIATGPSVDAILKFITARFGKILPGVFEFAIREPDGSLKLDLIPLLSNNKEKSAALWSFTNGKEAGWSSDTLPASENLYIPLQGYQKVIGLLIYKPLKKQILTTENKNFIYTVCQQLSHYLERLFSREKVQQHENLFHAQKIHKVILDRFFQIFHWPIEKARAAIISLKKKLKENYPEIAVIETELDALVKNLAYIAAMRELSEGMLPLKESSQQITEVIAECTINANAILNDHTLKVVIEENLPKVVIDYYLIYVLINNLLSSAIEYAEARSQIILEAKKTNHTLLLTVSNVCKPFSEAQLATIFDTSHPLQDSSESRLGLGLGLAMAKTIAEIHQGSLTVENLPTKTGVIFSFTLPIT